MFSEMQYMIFTKSNKEININDHYPKNKLIQ